MTIYTKRSRLGRVGTLALICAIGMVAASCGSDDDPASSATTPSASSESTPATDAPNVTDAPAVTTTDTPATEPVVSSSGGSSDLEGPAPEPLPEMTTVSVNGVAKVESFALTYLAEATGEFEKENIKIEWRTSPTADSLPFLADGSLDVALAPMSAAVMNGISQFDLRVIAPMQNAVGASKEGLWATKAFIDGLPGSLDTMKFATSTGPGTSITLPLKQVLDKYDRSITDVNFVQIPATDLNQALDSGAVDVAYLQYPQWKVAEDAGHQLLQSNGDLGSGTQVYLIGESLQNKPDVAAAFVRAVVRTARTYMQGNYRENHELMQQLADALEQPVADVEALPALVYKPNLDYKVEYALALQDIYRSFPDLLNYDKDLTGDQIFDSEFLDAATGAG